MVETALVTILEGIEPLAAIVAARIYPNNAPEGSAMPNLTYSLITGRSVRSLQGASNLRRADFQIDVWSTQDADVKGAIDAIYQYFRGGFAGPVGTYTIAWIEAEEDRDEFTNLASRATELGIYRDVLRLTVWYSQGT